MKKVALTSQARKVFQGSSRGFTLVEVLITIGLIGAISVAFFSFMSAATSALIHADERTIAESLARSQLEFVKNQGYNSTLVNGQATYEKTPSASIPAGYAMCSVNGNGSVVENVIIGVPWDTDTDDNKPSPTDTGIQKIALVIKHQDKEIYTFIDNNSAWHQGSVKITLEGYIRES
ncbi:MAG: type II secretion system GspH family protein [Dehalococcoidia bacterium]|nr:type II secretion system GspH family protein [Dehalococcoidia bacterium]